MTDTRPTFPPAGLLRRLAALVYDAFLLFAVLFLATAVALAFTGGEAVAAGNPLLSTWLLFVTFFFYGWFWTHGGQTLGMRAWRLRLMRRDGGPITWWHVLLRFMAAIPSLGLAGLGLLWVLVDREGLAWHDRYSETVPLKI